MTHLDELTRRGAPWVEGLARAGYTSKGVVYVLVGFLTALAALRSGRAADQADAFRFVLQQPFGGPFLAVIAAGLIGYAVWKVGAGAGDWEHKGNAAKGLGIRASGILIGLFYSGIAIEILRLVTGGSGGPAGSDTRAQHWTARAFDVPFGRWVVAASALGVIAYGIQQLVAAWKSKLNDRLRLGGMSPAARKRVVTISRAGIAARAVVFMIIGGSLLSAAITERAAQARGTAGAMQSISENPFGRTLLIAVALGVTAYGIYAFINARYRLIQPHST